MEEEGIKKEYVEIVEKMIQKSINKGDFKQVLGIAIECKRVDLIKTVLNLENQKDLVNYIFDIAINYVLNYEFKHELITIVIQYLNQKITKDIKDYTTLAQSYFILNQHESFAKLIHNLVLENKIPIAF